MKERHDEKSHLGRIFTGISEDNLVAKERIYSSKNARNSICRPLPENFRRG
jgi:hypothetical protein